MKAKEKIKLWWDYKGKTGAKITIVIILLIVFVTLMDRVIPDYPAKYEKLEAQYDDMVDYYESEIEYWEGQYNSLLEEFRDLEKELEKYEK